MPVSSNMPNKIAAPVPVTTQRKAIRIITTEEVAAGLQNIATSAPNRIIPERDYTIPERDYTVPAPPPPSPINFPSEKWSPMKNH